jgi:hypothetical protein
MVTVVPGPPTEGENEVMTVGVFGPLPVLFKGLPVVGDDEVSAARQGSGVAAADNGGLP